jgi:hypothetical protein
LRLAVCSQKKLHLFFWSSIYQQFCIHVNTAFIPLNPNFLSSLQRKTNWMSIIHSFSLASKAEEAPKLPQKERKKQTRRKAFCCRCSFFRRRGFLAAAAACAAVVATGVWSFFALFQQPSSRV